MKVINWNDASELGLIEKINREILHPVGLAMSRNQETGGSDSLLVADDGGWEYSPEIKPKEINGNELKKRIAEMAKDESVSQERNLVNGFYIWNGERGQDAMHPLYLDQVVQVVEGRVWVTGMLDEYSIDEASKFGSFGKCVLKTIEFETIAVDTREK